MKKDDFRSEHTEPVLKDIWETIKRTAGSRAGVLALVIFASALVLFIRLFSLQVIHGRDYQSDFQESTRRQITVPGERGCIYDRNGVLLAGNETCYNVMLRDETTDAQDTNAVLNEAIRNVILITENHGDVMSTDFGIRAGSDGSYSFAYEGWNLDRFLADIYGHAEIGDLTPEEKNKTPGQVVEDLADRYEINTSDAAYSGSVRGRQHLLSAVIARYLIRLNAYQQYRYALIAPNVSVESVREIEALKTDGLKVDQTYRRYYPFGEAMSDFLGYTGEISADELSSRQEKDPETDYRTGDTIGKQGIEASMEDALHGRNGSRTITVDNRGRELSATGSTAPERGRDVYLTIDSNLQYAAYQILEHDLAMILLDKISANTGDFIITEEMDSSDIEITISQVYAGCLYNLIDLSRFTQEDATEAEQTLYGHYLAYRESVLEFLRNEMAGTRTNYEDLGPEYRSYESVLVSRLYSDGILDSSLIDGNDGVYQAWSAGGAVSLYSFLYRAAEKGWIHTDRLSAEEGAGADQIVSSCIDYMMEIAPDSQSMTKQVYRYMCVNEAADPRLVCQTLIDQGLVELSEDELNRWNNGWESAYDFMIHRIRNLDLTPSDLHLYPYCGSMVVTDVNDGSVLAMVSYPGYDSNKITDGADADYLASLSANASKPMLNYATQSVTAPGSTFKMVTSTAALMEGVVDLDERLHCGGEFDKIDPAARCWISPGAHGNLALSSAITNSCNMYFYEVGYRLGQNDAQGRYKEGAAYSTEKGMEKLGTYAAMYGLDRKSGVETEESSPNVATRDSVRSAIGQSNHSYTTSGLARYVTAVASSGTVYDLTLVDKVCDQGGTNPEQNKAEVTGTVNMDSAWWDAIHEGMRGVTSSMSYRLGVTVAGKTGTAENAVDRPNHALFVGYWPYSEPEYAVACRIPYGYTSTYAAAASEHIISYMQGNRTLEQLTGTTSISGTSYGD